MLSLLLGHVHSRISRSSCPYARQGSLKICWVIRISFSFWVFFSKIMSQRMFLTLGAKVVWQTTKTFFKASCHEIFKSNKLLFRCRSTHICLVCIVRNRTGPFFWGIRDLKKVLVRLVQKCHHFTVLHT